MRRFWIQFPKYPFLPAGFGVTADDRSEAFEFIQKWFTEWGRQESMGDLLWSSAVVTEDVDVSELQLSSGLPSSHFCLPCNRGIWYPAVAIRADRFASELPDYGPEDDV